jgi:hypothetical protein
MTAKQRKDGDETRAQGDYPAQEHNRPAVEAEQSKRARLTSELAGAETLGTGRDPEEIRSEIEDLRPDATG